MALARSSGAATIQHGARTRTRLTAVAMAAALALTACGVGGGPAGSGKPDPRAVLKYGDDFAAVGFITDPIDFRGNSRTRVWMDLIYDTMFHETASGPVPSLALDAEYPDASTIVLTLRDGVTFQDGTPFNADAVKFSWDRFIATGDQRATPALRAMQSVAVLAPNKVKVTLNTPVAGEWKNRLLMESSSGLGVVSPTAVRKAEAEGKNFRDHPVGAGPYSFTQWVPNQKVSLTKFDHYWNPKRQPVGGFEFIQTATGTPRISALAAGTIDMAGISPTDIPAAEGRGLGVKQLPTLYTMGIQFCTTRAPFDNLKARQGVVHALDPAELNDLAFAGRGKLTQLPLPPDSPYADPELLHRYKFDRKQAATLLKEAGVAKGTTITLGTDSREQVYTSTAEIIQAQLKEVGLDVRIQPYQDPLTLSESRPDIAVFRTTWPLHTAMMPGAPLNFCDWQNPEFTKNYPITRSVDADKATLAAAYKATEKAVSDDLPTWWFYGAAEFQAHSSQVNADKAYTFKLSGFGQPDLTTFTMSE